MITDINEAASFWAEQANQAYAQVLNYYEILMAIAQALNVNTTDVASLPDRVLKLKEDRDLLAEWHEGAEREAMDGDGVLEYDRTIVVQINGKNRGLVSARHDATPAEIATAAAGSIGRGPDWDVLKTVFVPGVLINFVIP